MICGSYQTVVAGGDVVVVGVEKQLIVEPEVQVEMVVQPAIVAEDVLVGVELVGEMFVVVVVREFWGVRDVVVDHELEHVELLWATEPDSPHLLVPRSLAGLWWHCGEMPVGQPVFVQIGQHGSWVFPSFQLDLVLVFSLLFFLRFFGRKLFFFLFHLCSIYFCVLP